MTKPEIKKLAIKLAFDGKLFDLGKESQLDRFIGSVDRFAEIAAAFGPHHRVLDVGSEGGILLSLLTELGHSCHAVDITNEPDTFPEVYRKKNIDFQICNVEIDALPYPDDYFDAVSCSQCLEHFTHSHLPAMVEFHRVLKKDGILEIDVPNAASFRNRYRLLRGKHITFDYDEHYLSAEPIMYKGVAFYPLRHNREFTRDDLQLLFEKAGFRDVSVRFLKSRRLRSGISRLKSIGTAARDLVPGIRKSLIGFGRK